MHYLRKKIEPDIAAPRFILTLPRVGYRFKVDD
jgi:DNA-binding response OmpR family regulator